jgi:hypothetical protein
MKNNPTKALAGVQKKGEQDRTRAEEAEKAAERKAYTERDRQARETVKAVKMRRKGRRKTSAPSAAST